MSQRNRGKGSRWDQPPPNHWNNQNRQWDPYYIPHPNVSSQWIYAPAGAPPATPFSESDQFQSAYQSDRFDDYSHSYWKQDPAQASYYNYHNFHQKNRNQVPEKQTNCVVLNGKRKKRDQGGSTKLPGNVKTNRQTSDCTTHDGKNLSRSPEWDGNSQASPRKRGRYVNQNKATSSTMTNEKANPLFHERKGGNGQPMNHAKGILGSPPPFGNNWNRWNPSKNVDDDEEDESNEINHWLQISKGQESVCGNNKSPVSKDPLPGSQEARVNAIKEATDRLKQALKQKKSVNLNELLSSGDESKGDNQGNNTHKSFPKNLAQLELDATDMRAIGRANTERANVLEEEDDDIVEVARPPSPERLVIDLEDTPTKDSLSSISNRGSPVGEKNNHNDKIVPTYIKNLLLKGDGKSLERIQDKNVGSCEVSERNLFSRAKSPPSISLKPISNGDFNSNSDLNVEMDLLEDEVRQSDFVGYRSDNEESARSESALDRSIQTGSDHLDSKKVSTKKGGSKKCIPQTKPSGFVTSPKSTSLSSDMQLKSSPFRSPPSNLNQRRRTSSACESPTICSPRPGMASHVRSSPTLRSPPCHEQDHHDSRQRKIISDLQKISQNKLKDLINNPRSGKLDFAMRQLMKEHRAALSKKSRDVAEKRIPAEVLNRKQLDLPPDDSALLADFAIDWLSLPGELISTLGDLFQDFNSDIASNSQFCNSNGSSALGSLELPLADCSINNISKDTDLQMNCCDIEAPSSYTETEKDVETNANSTESSLQMERTQNVRIRVCQFARENLFSSESGNKIVLDQPVNIGISRRASVSSHQEHKQAATDLVSEDSDGNTDTETNGINLHQPSSCVNKGDRNDQTNGVSVDLHETLELQSTNISQRCSTKKTNVIDKSANLSFVNESRNSLKSTTSSSVCQSSDLQNIQESNANTAESITVRAEKKLEKNVVSSKPKQRGGKKKNKSSKPCKSPVIKTNQTTNRGRNQQRRFVHLEERTWFDGPQSKENGPSPLYPNNSEENSTLGESNNTLNTSEQSSGIQSVSDTNAGNEQSVDAPQPSDSKENSTVEENNDALNISERSSEIQTVSHTNSHNEFSIDKQCVSMLPVLMMTVPADGLADTLCNMSLPEVQKRLGEIDSQLQSLVQERFALSQALKALQSSAENNLASTSPTVENMDTESHNSQSPTSDSNVSPCVSDAPLPRKPNSKSLKRKKSKSLDDKLLKKVCQSKSSSSSKTLTGSDKTQSPAATLKDCYIQLESVSPETLQKNYSQSKQKLDVVVLDDDDDDDSSSAITDSTESVDLSNPKVKTLCFQKYPYVEGNILDMKREKKSTFVASQNGLVYMAIDYVVKATFGQVGKAATAVAVAFPNLYVGDSTGKIHVYDIPSKKALKKKGSEICKVTLPQVSYPIADSIHCLQICWDILFIGTKAGTVVPFDTKKGSVGKTLCLAGFPVLVIKTCMEGPRKVLIVACRNQPIAIRDADSGLLLRSIGDSNWLIYSLVLHQNLMICGSNSDKISAYDFQSGELKWQMPCGKGVIDMKINTQLELLYCGCYDGKLYIYNLKTMKLLCSYSGPGKMILCLDIFKETLVISSKGNSLVSCDEPEEVKRLKERKQPQPVKKNKIKSMKSC